VPKVHNKPIKRPSIGFNKRAKGNRWHLWSGAPDCPVHHRTVSGAPEDSNSNSSPSGKSQSRCAIIHRTVRCTPDSVRCSKRTWLWNSLASGICEDCFAIIHRTCPVYTGLSGVTAGQRLLQAPTATCKRIKCAPARAEVRHAHAGAPDTL
jgi:hypothetical protein